MIIIIIIIIIMIIIIIIITVIITIIIKSIIIEFTMLMIIIQIYGKPNAQLKLMAQVQNDRGSHRHWDLWNPPHRGWVG